MLKSLRIAVTALSLTACALLTALWVRSYSVPFRLIRPNAARTEAIGILSSRGRLIAGKFGFAMLAVDPQFALLNHKLNQEQFQLRNLHIMARSGRSKQIATHQRKIADLQQQIAQYRTQFAQAIVPQRQSQLPGNRPNVSSVIVPHWCLLLLAATLTAAPWIKWRFSLRTLLIATTLVAVVLGIVVAAR